MSTTTEIKPVKPFWAIVRSTDENGFHTGKGFHKIVMSEFDTAKDLSDSLAELSVEAGESMGDFHYKILGKSHSWDHLNKIVAMEEEEEKLTFEAMEAEE